MVDSQDNVMSYTRPLVVIDKQGNVIIGGMNNSNPYTGYIARANYTHVPYYLFENTGTNELILYDERAHYAVSLPINIMSKYNLIPMRYVGSISMRHDVYQGFIDISRADILHLVACSGYSPLLCMQLQAYLCCQYYVFMERGYVLVYGSNCYIIASDDKIVQVYKNHQLMYNFGATLSLSSYLVDQIAQAMSQGNAEGNSDRYLDTMCKLMKVYGHFGYEFRVCGKTIDKLLSSKIDFKRLDDELNSSEVNMRVLLDTNLVAHQFRRVQHQVGGLQDRIPCKGLQDCVKIELYLSKDAWVFLLLNVDCNRCGKIRYSIKYNMTREEYRKIGDGTCIRYIDDLLARAPIYTVLSENQIKLWAEFISMVNPDNIKIIN